ncbi:MAG: hypothetical protein DRG87_01525 [Deltaproteobacteria bacterium]|nr:MAG: hypothetical protein DRG87_01525 [Deltaproteobacteria bacterium]
MVEKLCGVEISSTQVSKAAQLLDEEIEAGRNRQLGAIKYLVLDATYESVRIGVSVVSGSVVMAVGERSWGCPHRSVKRKYTEEPSCRVC